MPDGAVDIRRLRDAQLKALGDVCSCRLNAECWQLMQSLAMQGALPASVLSMSDEDWLRGCTALPGQPSRGP